MGAPIIDVPGALLLADTTVLALVGMVVVAALGIACLTAVAIVFGRRRETTHPTPAPPAAAPAPIIAPMPARPQATEPRAARTPPRAPAHRNVEIDVPTPHVDAFVAALRGQGWVVHETGVVVATDEHEEGLTTVAIELPIARRESSGEEVH